jgi:hypothetical protein
MMAMAHGIVVAWHFTVRHAMCVAPFAVRKLAFSFLFLFILFFLILIFIFFN